MKNFILAAAILFSASNLRAQLNVYYIDVGQGDATYIELPNGKNVLIDGGPSGAMVDKFLKEKGVTQIEHVVLTHPHSDHYRGLKKVFTGYKVKHFYDTRLENLEAKGDNNLRELAFAQGTSVHFPETGSNLNWDSNVTVKVLNSCTEVIETRKSSEVNDCSIVLRFYYNGTGLLFTGDIESPIENAITRVFKSGLQSYSLKVAHHGSRYSSTEKFLERVQPQVAIVSVGVDNTYGHPHAEALDRLRASGAKIYFTLGKTQTLFLPKPTKGIAPLPILRPYEPGQVIQPAVEAVVYQPPVEAPFSVNGPALEQLQTGAF